MTTPPWHSSRQTSEKTSSAQESQLQTTAEHSSLFPPRPIHDIWTDPRIDLVDTLEERLILAGCMHSQEKTYRPTKHRPTRNRMEKNRQKIRQKNTPRPTQPLQPTNNPTTKNRTRPQRPTHQKLRSKLHKKSINTY